MKLPLDPPWLQRQRNLSYPGKGGSMRRPVLNQEAISFRYVQALQKANIRVTHDAMRAMLVSLNRGYVTTPAVISRLIHGLDKGKPEMTYPNGHRVVKSEAGRKQEYKSLNEAAKKENCSPESVRQWAKSGRPNRKGQVWRFVDPEEDRSRRRKSRRQT